MYFEGQLRNWASIVPHGSSVGDHTGGGKLSTKGIVSSSQLLANHQVSQFSGVGYPGQVTKRNLCVWVFCLQMSVHHTHAWCPWRPEKGFRAPGAELHSYILCVGAGNRTQVL